MTDFTESNGKPTHTEEMEAAIAPIGMAFCDINSVMRLLKM